MPTKKTKKTSTANKIAELEKQLASLLAENAELKTKRTAQKREPVTPKKVLRLQALTEAGVDAQTLEALNEAEITAYLAKDENKHLDKSKLFWGLKPCFTVNGYYTTGFVVKPLPVKKA